MTFSVPDHVQQVAPYIPGKPIEETQREFGLKRVVKLASNENPLGPSPRGVMAARRVLADTHRYPDSSGFHLKQALSKKLKVPAASIFLGNGSNDVIDSLVRAFCVQGDAMVTSQAAFLAYRLSAQIHGVRTLEAPLTAELRFDLSRMLELVRSDARAKLVFIANPNNPTGTYVAREELRSFLREVREVRGGSVIVALDYAYWEYVNAKDLPDPLEIQAEFPNVIVMRTFSKIYGLAGFRIGYGVADPSIVGVLDKVRQPFNMNSLSLAAAEAALSDKAFLARARKVNDLGRKFWEAALKKLGIPFWPSQGNFVLADVQAGLGMSGPEVFHECLKRGVIFRPVANYGMPGALRISYGTPAENAFALKALAALKSGVPAKSGKAVRSVGKRKRK